MANTTRIGLIGDFKIEVRAHTAIPRALALASDGGTYDVETSWLATPLLAEHNTEQLLSTFDAFWCVPGSPYESMEGALNAIRFAREGRYPFLGTCGGFQHTLIEYARNVLGLTEADHAESNPTAALPLIAPLACSLVGAQGTIQLQPSSRISSIYGSNQTLESYFCNYGFNSQFQSLFEDGEMRITGVDSNGEARVIELIPHPFFIATLFQPELSAFSGISHPLVAAFLQAACSQRRGVTV